MKNKKELKKEIIDDPKVNDQSKEDFDTIKPKHRIKKFFIKLFLSICLIIFIVLISISAFKIYCFKKLAKEMFNATPSTIFDSNKNVIAQIGIERNREYISISDIPKNLVNAYISIEDQRFYNHHGVDIKRTGAAIFYYITKFGSHSFGGSTITQQLVKNLTGDNSSSIKRKLKEWSFALCLETTFSKEELLEAYFNIIYTGPNIYGVQEASKYYFNKNVQDLSLEECCFLAGLNHSPNTYNPFTDQDRTEKINKRCITVLNKMLELGYITQTEFDNAKKSIEDGLNFNKGEISRSTNINSYHTDALVSYVINDLTKKYSISQNFATNFLYLSGSTIYSTQNTEIQSTLEQECKNTKYTLKSANSENFAQAAIVVIDHSTGYVQGCVGGLGEKNSSRGLNRVTQMKRQTGSAMKPIAVLAPALSQKLITNVTLFEDKPSTFTDFNGKPYSPIDYDDYKGTITLRKAVESSQNIPFVTIMNELTPQVSIKYLKRMGITTLNKNDINLSLALGGLDEGISPLEFASAYATIANDGLYIEPTFYTKITSNSNQTILKKNQRMRKVLSKNVAFILKDLLIEPVKGKNGTATYCNIPNIDVAAKTGTTNENYDRWLCGFTPYFTAVCWYGFDMNESINFDGKNPAGLIWSNSMKTIHSKLPNAKFEKPNGVEKILICEDSRKKATKNCSNTYYEYFLHGTIPGNCLD